MLVCQECTLYNKQTIFNEEIPIFNVKVPKIRVEVGRLKTKQAIPFLKIPNVDDDSLALTISS